MSSIANTSMQRFYQANQGATSPLLTSSLIFAISMTLLFCLFFCLLAALWFYAVHKLRKFSDRPSYVWRHGKFWRLPQAIGVGRHSCLAPRQLIVKLKKTQPDLREPVVQCFNAAFCRSGTNKTLVNHPTAIMAKNGTVSPLRVCAAYRNAK